MAIAKDSAQVREPYTTFRKCPEEIPQRSANAARSFTAIESQKSFRSMSDYHHTVMLNATPTGEFTKWCYPNDNLGMGNTMADTRRQNLARLIVRDFRGNKSEIARAYDSSNPKPQYFSDLLRPDGGKSFGEKAARKIEEKAGLRTGQLDIPDSPLLHDETKRDKLKDTTHLAVDDLDRDELRETLDAIRRIQARRRRRA